MERKMKRIFGTTGATSQVFATGFMTGGAIGGLFGGLVGTYQAI
jgi:ABC-type nitrate/sulfonate/bicarbonate transport system permease component